MGLCAAARAFALAARIFTAARAASWLPAMLPCPRNQGLRRRLRGRRVTSCAEPLTDRGVFLASRRPPRYPIVEGYRDRRDPIASPLSTPDRMDRENRRGSAILASKLRTPSAYTASVASYSLDRPSQRRPKSKGDILSGTGSRAEPRGLGSPRATLRPPGGVRRGLHGVEPWLQQPRLHQNPVRLSGRLNAASLSSKFGEARRGTSLVTWQLQFPESLWSRCPYNAPRTRRVTGGEGDSSRGGFNSRRACGASVRTALRAHGV